MKFRTVFFALVMLMCNVAIAQEIQSLQLIDNKVKDYIRTQVSPANDAELIITTDPIDSRLQLKLCQHEQVEVFNPYHAAFAGNLTIGVRCQESDNHWTLYIPAHIKIEKQVVIAQHPIIRGTEIKDSDLKMMSMDVSQLKQGYYTETQTICGQIAKQTINQGSAIIPYNLERAVMIRKGMHITIEAASDMIQVSMPGIAMENGSLHDKIRVQNSKSKRFIDAEIIDSKKVKVTI